MPRKMRVLLGGVEAWAEFYEDLAPKTCDAVWNALPIQYGHVLHARFSGEEIFFPAPRVLYEKENEKFDCVPGDVSYFADAPGICIYYGKLHVITPGSVFARVTENWEELYRVAKQVWKDHNIPVRLERWEEQA